MGVWALGGLPKLSGSFEVSFASVAVSLSDRNRLPAVLAVISVSASSGVAVAAGTLSVRIEIPRFATDGTNSPCHPYHLPSWRIISYKERALKLLRLYNFPPKKSIVYTEYHLCLSISILDFLAYLWYNGSCICQKRYEHLNMS